MEEIMSSGEKRVEICDWCKHDVKYCNSPSCDDTRTHWVIITADKIEEKEIRFLSEDKMPSEGKQLCCEACRMPLRYCNSPSCDDASTYLGIIDKKNGMWVPVDSVSGDVRQKVIVTTEDRLRLCLSEHLERMERKGTWVGPLGVFTMIVLTLITSTFKDVILDGATWKALFTIMGFISLTWLSWSIVAALRSESSEDFIELLVQPLSPKPIQV